MTEERPEIRWYTVAGKIVVSLFLLVVGGLANQFWNIPVQQMHQDDRLNAIEKHMEYNDARLDKFEVQISTMEHQLQELRKEQ